MTPSCWSGVCLSVGRVKGKAKARLGRVSENLRKLWCRTLMRRSRRSEVSRPVFPEGMEHCRILIWKTPDSFRHPDGAILKNMQIAHDKPLSNVRIKCCIARALTGRAWLARHDS